MNKRIRIEYCWLSMCKIRFICMWHIMRCNKISLKCDIKRCSTSRIWHRLKRRAILSLVESSQIFRGVFRSRSLFATLALPQIGTALLHLFMSLPLTIILSCAHFPAPVLRPYVRASKSTICAQHYKNYHHIIGLLLSK